MLTQALLAHVTKWNARIAGPHAQTDTQSLYAVSPNLIPSSALFFSTVSHVWVQLYWTVRSVKSRAVNLSWCLMWWKKETDRGEKEWQEEDVWRDQREDQRKKRRGSALPAPPAISRCMQIKDDISQIITKSSIVVSDNNFSSLV